MSDPMDQERWGGLRPFPVAVEEAPLPAPPDPDPEVGPALEPEPAPDAAVPKRRGGRQLVVVVALAIVLAVVGVVVSRATSDTKKAAAPTAAPGVPPRGPNTLVYDRFDRTAGATSLGKTETGQQWATVGAPWTITGNQAAVASTDSAKGTVAVIRAGASDGTVQARVAKVAPGAGIVFRYKDAFDYWGLTAAPKYGTWNLVRVTDGKVAVVATTGKTGAVDGQIISVRFKGDEVVASINGVEQATVHDSALATERVVGLVATADDQRAARFDDFVVTASTPTATTVPTTLPSVHS